MRLLVILILFVVPVFCKAQDAQIKTLNGIIIHEYNMTSYGTFCEGLTYFIYKKDTFLLLNRIDYNQAILKKYPEIQKQIGKPDLYVSNQFKMDWHLDLHFIDYNRFEFDGEKTLVNSNTFYCEEGLNIIYTAYQVFAEFVEYKGVLKYGLELMGNEEIIEDCFCPKIKVENITDNFFVVKQIHEFNKLTNEQQQELKLNLTGIKTIEVFYCE